MRVVHIFFHTQARNYCGEGCWRGLLEGCEMGTGVV